MLRNKGIRFKLGAVLAAPTLALLVLSSIGYTDRRHDAVQTRQVGQYAALAARVSSLVHDLQTERDIAVSAPVGDSVAPGTILHSTLDTSIEGFRSFAQPLADGVASADFEAALSHGLEALDRIPSLRLAASGPDVFEGYSAVIADLLAVDARIPAETTDPRLASHVTAFATLAEGKEYAAQERSLLSGVFTAAAFPTAAYDQLVEVIALQDATFDRYRISADATERAALETALQGEAGPPVADMRSSALAAGREGATAVDPTVWLYYSSARIDALKALEDESAAGIFSEARHLQNRAEQEALLFAAGAVVAVLLALLIAVMFVRATIRPLRRLTEVAHSVARVQLPGLVERLKTPGGDVGAVSVETVEVESTDEIGQLAEAFNAIQAVAVEVAREQAVVLRKGITDLYVNLARRNQALLDRQISFIDELEQHERDPDTLENLFTLDHLATRMRRNAESLLVLAGVEPNRRWEKPVGLPDVIRSAIGEVEEFSRVELVAFDDVTVAGRAAVDLAHLLAELLENATHFSPPGSMVEVSGILGDQGYLVAIVDHGIGMGESHLNEHNALLARPPVMGLTLSRTLGMIVVSRLAARFQIGVRLMATPGGGATVHVAIPTALLAPVDAPAPSRPTFVGHAAPVPASPAVPALAAPVAPVEVRPARPALAPPSAPIAPAPAPSAAPVAPVPAALAAPSERPVGPASPGAVGAPGRPRPAASPSPDRLRQVIEGLAGSLDHPGVVKGGPRPAGPAAFVPARPEETVEPLPQRRRADAPLSSEPAAPTPSAAGPAPTAATTAATPAPPVARRPVGGPPAPAGRNGTLSPSARRKPIPAEPDAATPALLPVRHAGGVVLPQRRPANGATPASVEAEPITGPAAAPAPLPPSPPATGDAPFVPRKASDLGIEIPPLMAALAADRDAPAGEPAAALPRRQPAPAADAGAPALPRRRSGGSGPAVEVGASRATAPPPARKRSPDEVRQNLTRYRAAKLDGQAAGRSERSGEPATTSVRGDGPDRPLTAAMIPGDTSRSPER